MRFEFISAEATYALRNQMLRPGLPVETVHFGGDDDPGTRHLGAYSNPGSSPRSEVGDLASGAGARLVGVVTLLESPLPPELARAAPTHLRAWQLRGMATSPEVRGQGYGQGLVRACLKYVRDTAGQGVIWCNARTSALSFYAAFGFVPHGAQFDIPHGGPHFRMLARVTPVVALDRIPGSFAVVRIAPDTETPSWLAALLALPGFVSVTRTADELSVVCLESALPANLHAIAGPAGPAGTSGPQATSVQRGWCALRVRGSLDFSLTGILASLTEPLACAGIPLFAISTFDTDFILVPATDFEAARNTWLRAGHEVP